MELARQLLERVLDLLVSRSASYAERLVRVLHAPNPIATAPQSTIPRPRRGAAKITAIAKIIHALRPACRDILPK